MNKERIVQHTPGPWTAYTDPRNKVTAFQTDTHPTRFWRAYVNAFVGLTASPAGATPEECSANAYLIAAAPELLDALRTARFVIQVALDAGQVTEANVRTSLNQIDAAIAKAEGR